MKSTSISFSFTSQLSNLKNTLILWEDVVAKTVKLSASLRSVIHSIAGFLEAFQKVADAAYGSNCGLRELGSSMTRFCLRERGLESRLRTFNSQLQECLASPLADRLEEWRRTVAQLDRENNKEWRRARSELQRVTYEFDKLNKRFRRKGSSGSHHEPPNNFDTDSLDKTGDNVQLNFLQHDLELKRRTMAELERSNLRRAVVEERRRFAELITCLKPVFESQLAVFSDVQSIDECASAIVRHAFDPNDLPSDTEQAIGEAVARASSNLNLNERKFSDVRAAMRFGKHGTGFDFSRSTLFGHPSQLSLQSTASGSTACSWNAIASAAASSSLTRTHSSSPSHGDPGLGDRFPTSIVPPNSGHKSTVIPSVDSLSLFDSGDGSVVVGDPRRDLSAYPTNFPLKPPDLCVIVDPPSDLNQTATSVQGDLEEEDREGATTEDTEDGETEDDEHILTSEEKERNRSKPILYPNQAIPAPVYTNLNELKRAAARKFSLADSGPNETADCRQLNERSPEEQVYSTCSPQPTVVYGTTVNPIQAESPDFETQRSQYEDFSDGFIGTCINSGTSTFRRRQSEYAARHLNHPMFGTSLDDTACKPGSYVSVTPGLIRRGGQTYADVSGVSDGRSRSNRPAANPPRRSSSVSRDLTKLRHSTADHYSAYPFRNQQHINGIDPGIQRVSSSVFTDADNDSFQAIPDSRLSNSRNGLSRPVHVSSGMIPSTQYASVCASSCHPIGTTRAERIATMPRLTPPPLASSTTAMSSKNNQLMFGIKVLPSQTQLPCTGSVQYGRFPQRYLPRQVNCEPGLVYPPIAIASSQSAVNTPHVISCRPTLAKQEQRVNPALVFKDDGVTSFID